MLSNRTVCVAVALILALMMASCDDTTKPGPARPIDSPAHLIDAFAIAYRTRDYDRFAPLVARGPDSEFRFQLVVPLPSGDASWASASELLLHRRMFRPDALQPRETPVSPDLRLASVDIQMHSQTAFIEKPEYLRSPENPRGLDPQRWRALEATYSCWVLFDTAGPRDYLVNDLQKFVVIEDLDKQVGEEGRFLLYRWQEVGREESGATEGAGEPRTRGVIESLWGQMKQLYANASPVVSEAAAIQEFRDAYQQRSYGRFAALLSREPGAEYVFILNQPDPDTGEANWGLAEELRIHHRMFAPESIPAGDPPVHRELWLAAIDVALTQQVPFTERADLYRSNTNPNGLDPERWRGRAAVFGTYALFDTQGELDYRVDGRAAFIVVEDRDRLSGTPGKFLLYRWEDLGSGYIAGSIGNPSEGSGVEAKSWTGVKALYK